MTQVPALLWGCVAPPKSSPDFPGSVAALGVMAQIAGTQGSVWRGSGALLAQFGGSGGLLVRHDHDLEASSVRYRVAAACRLDNRSDLCRMLGLDTSVTDTTLVAAAYGRWGDACPEHLLGDFAVVVWDTVAGILFCARDALGILPFYYWQRGGAFCFASDLEGLLAHPSVEPKLNLHYVKAFLLYDNDYVHPHYSFFDAIFKLPPGHSLSFRDGTVSLKRYWNPATVYMAVPNQEKDCTEQLRTLLTEAVRCRLDAESPTGAHLSGGLDSSAVAVLAARLSREPLQTFSWSTPGDLSRLELEHDERREIDILHAAEGLAVHYTEITADQVLHTFGDLTRTPQVHRAVEQVVLLKARALGVRTLLSGWGGDEGVSYYGRAYLSELLLRGRPLDLFRELRGWAERDGLSVWHRGLRRAIGFSLPERARLRYNRFREGPRTLPTCLSPEFHEALSHVEAYPWDDFMPKGTVRDDLVALLTRGPVSYRTEAWHAQATRQGLNYRYPLLDRRIVEFSLNVPSRFFFHHAQSRYLFREATRGILPDDIRLKTLKRDPALEEPQYALFNALLKNGDLYRRVAAQPLGQSRFLDGPTTLASVATSRTLQAFGSDPRGVSRALWLAFLHPDTFW